MEQEKEQGAQFKENVKFDAPAQTLEEFMTRMPASTQNN